MPTENTDGTPLTDLDGVRFYEASVTGGPYAQIADTDVCELTIERLEGTYYFVGTAYNTAGTESEYSNETSRVVPPSVPNPPFGLSVTSELVAYGLQQSPDVVTVFPVGTVDAGTACDPSMSVNGKYRVPLSAVTYAGSVRPVVVFAACAGG